MRVQCLKARRSISPALTAETIAALKSAFVNPALEEAQLKLAQKELSRLDTKDALLNLELLEDLKRQAKTQERKYLLQVISYIDQVLSSPVEIPVELRETLKAKRIKLLVEFSQLL